MKTIILALLFLFALVSCGNDDDAHKEESHEFRDNLLGWYRLEAAYTDTPLDLNGDGIMSTDIFAETSHCEGTLSPQYYLCRFVHHVSFDDDWLDISVDVPYSKYSMFEEDYTTCVYENKRFYQCEVNEKSKEVIIEYDYPELQDEFRIWIQEVNWEDETAYFTFKKEFYTSAGTWEEVTLYMEYKLDPDYGKN